MAIALWPFESYKIYAFRFDIECYKKPLIIARNFCSLALWFHHSLRHLSSCPTTSCCSSQRVKPKASNKKKPVKHFSLFLIKTMKEKYLHSFVSNSAQTSNDRISFDYHTMFRQLSNRISLKLSGQLIEFDRMTVLESAPIYDVFERAHSILYQFPFANWNKR